MLWLYIALVAQFLNAAVILLDRFLVTSKTIKHPVVYAFYVSILSGVVIVLWPLGYVRPPTADVVWLSLAVAVTYIFSILCLYKSLKISEASDVAPVMGAISASATFIFSLLILETDLSPNFLIGFILLVAGTALMSSLRLSFTSVMYAMLAGILFGLSSVIMKVIFSKTDFLDGFFWSRMANVASALMLLIWPGNLRAVTRSLLQSSSSTKLLVLANKTLAGLALLLIFIAIKLGEVSLVNAASGLQFVFLLFFALIFTKEMPRFFSETINDREVLWHKFIATAFIVSGFFVLFL